MSSTKAAARHRAHRARRPGARLEPTARIERALAKAPRPIRLEVRGAEHVPSGARFEITLRDSRIVAVHGPTPSEAQDPIAWAEAQAWFLDPPATGREGSAP